MEECCKKTLEEIINQCNIRKELHYEDLSEAYKTGWATAIKRVTEKTEKEMNKHGN